MLNPSHTTVSDNSPPAKLASPPGAATAAIDSPASQCQGNFTGKGLNVPASSWGTTMLQAFDAEQAYRPSSFLPFQTRLGQVAAAEIASYKDHEVATIMVFMLLLNILQQGNSTDASMKRLAIRNRFNAQVAGIGAQIDRLKYDQQGNWFDLWANTAASLLPIGAGAVISNLEAVPFQLRNNVWNLVPTVTPMLQSGARVLKGSQVSYLNPQYQSGQSELTRLKLEQLTDTERNVEQSIASQTQTVQKNLDDQLEKLINFLNQRQQTKQQIAQDMM